MTVRRRPWLDVLLGAMAITALGAVLGLLSNHYVRRPVVLLPPPRAPVSARSAPPLPAPSTSGSAR